MPVYGNISVEAEIGQTGSNAFSGGPTWAGAMALRQIFGDGTTANKFDRAYMAERTVASASNDDIDLAGVLTDALGQTITAAEVVAVLIINQRKDGTANTTSLSVGGGSNPYLGFFTGTTPVIRNIGPGGIFLLSSPDATGLGAVVAGTGDILRITNGSGASNTYQICILARTA